MPETQWNQNLGLQNIHGLLCLEFSCKTWTQKQVSFSRVWGANQRLMSCEHKHSKEEMKELVTHKNNKKKICALKYNRWYPALLCWLLSTQKMVVRTALITSAIWDVHSESALVQLLQSLQIFSFFWDAFLVTLHAKHVHCCPPDWYFRCSSCLITFWI